MVWDRWVTAAGLRARSLVRRARVEQELDDELSYHLDQLTTRGIAGGMAPEQARAAALRTLGGLAYTKDVVRDTRRVRVFEDLVRDVHVAWRAMWRQPGSTLLMLATLALGLGTTTAMFSLVNGVLLRKPYHDVDRIVWILEQTPRGDLSPVSTLNYDDWRTRTQSFDALASWGFGAVSLSGVATPMPLRAAYVASTYFTIFGISPELGRTFTPDDEQPGHDQVALISHGLWNAQFGRDPAIIGRSIRLRDQVATIVGVLPQSASTAEWGWTEVWLPHVLAGDVNRSYRSFNVYGRLRAGVTIDQARAEMSGIAAALGRTYPEADRGWGVSVTPFMDILLRGGLRESLLVMLASVAVLLVIASVNLANMMLIRALAREQECAIRAALGGGRGRLIRQLVTESLVLAACGGSLGLLLSPVLLAGIRAMLPLYSSPGHLPPRDVVVMDGSVYLFALAISVLTTLMFGLIPARAATRTDIVRGLKGGRGASASSAGDRVRAGLVVAEVALAFALLATAGVLVESFSRLQRTDTGFDAANVWTAQVPLPATQTGTPLERAVYLDRLLKAIQLVPAVTHAAWTSALPLQGAGTEVPYQPIDGPALTRAERPAAFFKMVTPDYFQTLALALRRGRLLTDRDEATSPRVLLINDTMARTTFAGRDPVGQQLLIPELVTTGRTRFGEDVAWEIVGVVADERVTDMKETRVSAGVYVPLAQSTTRRPALVVRTAGDRATTGIETALRCAAATLNPDQPLAEVRTLDAIKEDSIGSDRQRSLIVGLFAACAVVLAAIGLYGVMACAVLQRRHELGIRAALGAGASQLAGLIVRDGGALVVAGLAVGLILSRVVSAVLSRQLFGVAPPPLSILLVTALVLTAITLAACLLPASRATTANPLTSLRAD